MDALFWYKLGLSFVVGGSWVAVTTCFAERYGSRIGGLIGGLPSTAVVSLFFIGFTQTPHVASEATTIIPVAQGVNGLFIIIFILLIRWGLSSALSGGLVIWFVMATVIVLLDIHHFWKSIAGWLFLLFGCYAFVEKGLKISSRGKITLQLTSSQVIYRALFGGSVIVFAVFIGKLGGPVYGGIFATFPAMFLSTLFITHRTGGADFSKATAKSLMISGLINVPLYAVAVRTCYPLMGLALGTATALIFSFGTGYLSYFFIKVKLS